MHRYHLARETWVSAPIHEVFDFFSRAENLETITPPWLKFHIITPLPIEMGEGTLIAYSLRIRGLPVHWLSRIERWHPPFEFVDAQIRGPYKRWVHRHLFAEENGGTRIKDSVELELPFGALGAVTYRWLVSRDLKSIFDFRQREIYRRFGESTSVTNDR